MNHSKYIEFHDKFTEVNQFEFSRGIYIARDHVRGREVNNKLLSEYLELLKTTPGLNDVFGYLSEKNKGSDVTIKAIEFLKSNPLNKSQIT